MNHYAQKASAWAYGVAIVTALMAAAGGGYLALANYFSRGELGTKDYYATLQGVEYENRGNKNPNPILKKNVNGSGLDVLGVVGGDTSTTRVWVVLNRTSPDGWPLILPQDVPVKPDCGSIRQTLSGERVVDAARQYLLKNCTHRP